MTTRIEQIAQLLSYYSNTPFGARGSTYPSIKHVPPVSNQRGFVNTPAGNAITIEDPNVPLSNHFFQCSVEADSRANLETIIASILRLQSDYQSDCSKGSLDSTSSASDVSCNGTSIRSGATWVSKGYDIFEAGISPWVETVATVTTETVSGTACLKVGGGATATRNFDSGNSGLIQFYYKCGNAGAGDNYIYLRDSSGTNICYFQESAFVGTRLLLFYFEFNGFFNFGSIQLDYESWNEVVVNYNNTTHQLNAWVNGYAMESNANEGYINDVTLSRIVVTVTDTPLYFKSVYIPDSSGLETAYLKFALSNLVPSSWTVDSAILTIPVTGEVGGTYALHGITGNVDIATVTEIAGLTFTTASNSETLAVADNAIDVETIVAENVAAGQFLTGESGFRIYLTTAAPEIAIIGDPSLSIIFSIPSGFPYLVEILDGYSLYDGTNWKYNFILNGNWLVS
jgi:hypothetical protein